MSKWRDYLAGGDEPKAEEIPAEEPGATEEEEKPKEEVPQPAVMTADAVQIMLDRQAEQMEKNFNTLVSGLQTAMTPQEKAQQVAMPTDAEFEDALEKGDSKRFLQLQKQKDVAMATIYDNRLSQAEAAANDRVLALQEQVVVSSVPVEYKKDVDSMMDELGIERGLRSNPKVLEFLTLAAKGKNADAEKAAAAEAAKRQANLEPTSDVASGGRPVGGHETPAPVFSNDALAALTAVGRDQDKFAQGMGYASWKDYEDATTNLMTAEQVTHRWMKKGK